MPKLLLGMISMSVGIGFGIAQTTPENDYQYPKISDYGKVVRLPEAAAQPRSGSRICVDLTAGGPRDAINPGVEKLARYVNIYAGAGREAADVKIAVILHGQATPVALDDDAYAREFKTGGNPNLPLIRELRKADVEFLVCGQSLVGSGFSQVEVAPQIDVAVSALTANVNFQSDGWAFIPLH